MNLKTEKFYWRKGYRVVIGLDEAGRGPLAGPVFAAAVVINSKINKKNKNFRDILKIARDSKQLSVIKREKIVKLLKNCPEIMFSYASVNEKIIDKINIEQASFLAMRKCIKKLKNKHHLLPDILLIDGNRRMTVSKHYSQYQQRTIVKGDDKIFSIALASIIAKVKRDKKMIALSKKYPQYKFDIHKGYPTKLHRHLIKKYGPAKIHRKSYQPIKQYG